RLRSADHRQHCVCEEPAGDHLGRRLDVARRRGPRRNDRDLTGGQERLPFVDRPHALFAAPNDRRCVGARVPQPDVHGQRFARILRALTRHRPVATRPAGGRTYLIRKPRKTRTNPTTARPAHSWAWRRSIAIATEAPVVDESSRTPPRQELYRVELASSDLRAL